MGFGEIEGNVRIWRWLFTQVIEYHVRITFNIFWSQVFYLVILRFNFVDSLLTNCFISIFLNSLLNTSDFILFWRKQILKLRKIWLVKVERTPATDKQIISHVAQWDLFDQVSYTCIRPYYKTTRSVSWHEALLHTGTNSSTIIYLISKLHFLHHILHQRVKYTPGPGTLINYILSTMVLKIFWFNLHSQVQINQLLHFFMYT